MNILGEGFHPNIIGQIDARQKVFASGYNPNNPRTPEYIAYANSNTSFLRMMSSVSLNDLEILNNPTVKTLGLKGTELAKKAILFGGVKSLDSPLQGGILNNSSPSVFNDFAYGWGGTEYGLRPMPGLLSATVKSENIGSLKTATINIKAWSRTQFEIIDVLYLRLGFYVVLEWGHVNYINNQGELQKNIFSLESEFFSKDASVDGIQKSIIDKRYNSYGNYDAMLGRVVNFSWTFEDDGSYNITVIVRSIGDIIESLKTNILTKSSTLTELATGKSYKPGSEPVKNPFASSSSKTDSYPNKSNIHIRLNKLKELVDTEKFDGIRTELSNNKLVDIRRVKWSNNNLTFYIRFGALLKLLEEEVIGSIYKGSSSEKLIKFDYDIKSNLLNYIDAQVSTDPRKVLIEREFNINNQSIKILPGAEDFITTISNESYGQLMNVYINFDYIISLLDDLNNQMNNKVILIDFLKNLCATISNCLGAVNNITPIIDDDTNTIKFIDQNALYRKNNVITYLKEQKYDINTDPGIFDLYGYNPGKYNQSGSAGFIKEFTMKTELTSQFASMISTGAAARSKVVGEDATALSKLNAGLTSSLFETLVDPDIDINKPLSLEEQYKQTITDYYSFIKDMNMLGVKPIWNEASFSSFPSILNSFITFAEQSTYEKTQIPSTSTGFIPLNVSLTMTGMSGMKIYQEFILDTDYLPSNYSRVMSWLIKGVTHNISDNTWTTIIESLSIPNNNNVTKPVNADFRVSNIINDTLDVVTEGNPLSENSRVIVEKIINRARTLGINDKFRLTAILTVALAEANFRPSISESFNYRTKTPEDIARLRTIFSSKLKNKSDTEIKNIFSTQESAANFLYGGVFGNGPKEGYKYRGRGFSQITFKNNYLAMNKLLAKNLSGKLNPSSFDIILDPDLANNELISIEILILGKINGSFGDKLNPAINYTTNPTAILRTQNRAAAKNAEILKHYSKSLNTINRTKWIQDLLNK